MKKVKNGNIKFNNKKIDLKGNYEKMNPFTLHEMDLQSGDTIYSFSDGYADQFGGTFGKKNEIQTSKGFTTFYSG